ncbi:MAG TPA: ABC transporter permease [Ignavibacteriaceae bacterium]|nr:ABC transporter permease [Ignavibacteriaceae bacterium]
MTNILNLIKKDYRLFWNDKVAVALTFLVPAALILVFGSIFGGSGGGDASGIRLAFINQSNSKIARKIESTLDTTKTFQMIKSFTDDKGNEVPFDTNSIKEYIINGSASSALVIPKDAYTDTSFGLKLRFFYNPRNQLEMQIVQGLLQQTIMTQIPEIFNQSMMRRSEEYLGTEKGGMFNRRMASVISEYFGVDTSEILKQGFQSFENDSTAEDTSSSKAASQFFKDIVRLDSEQLVGKEINNPGATRSVGGWAMMFLLFSITASAASLFDERNSGVTLRILSAPVSRTDILWSKYLYNISLGVIQLLVLFFMGYLFFNINIFSNFGNLLLVIILSSAAATAFGMVLAAFSKTTAQANGLGTFLILMMSTIGGAWFPTFFLPPFIQILSKFTIVYWSVEGFLQVLWNGDGFIEILPTIGMLIGIGMVINAISFWRFRRGDIF